MLIPANKPANCGEERTLPLSKVGAFAKFASDLVGEVGTSFSSEIGKIEVIILKKSDFSILSINRYGETKRTLR